MFVHGSAVKETRRMKFLAPQQATPSPGVTSSYNATPPTLPASVLQSALSALLPHLLPSTILGVVSTRTSFADADNEFLCHKGSFHGGSTVAPVYLALAPPVEWDNKNVTDP